MTLRDTCVLTAQSTMFYPIVQKSERYTSNFKVASWMYPFHRKDSQVVQQRRSLLAQTLGVRVLSYRSSSYGRKDEVMGGYKCAMHRIMEWTTCEGKEATWSMALESKRLFSLYRPGSAPWHMWQRVSSHSHEMLWVKIWDKWVSESYEDKNKNEDKTYL